MPKIVLMKEKDQNGKIDYIIPEPRKRRLFEPERISINKPQTIPNLEEPNEEDYLPENNS